MSCPDCFSGHINPGKPTGRFETVHTLRTYIAEPPSGKPAKAVIVIIPDAFGVGFVNNQVLADHYAAAGDYLVYLPDFMDGKEAPVSTMINMALMFDEKTSWFAFPYYLVATLVYFLPFLYTNRSSVTWPRITAFLQSVRSSPSTATLPLGVAGFCWGGFHAVRLCHDTAETRVLPGGDRPLIDASFTAHPSNLTVPADIEGVVRPLSIAIGDNDKVMAMKEVETAREILDAKAKDTGLKTEVIVYPGAMHGFAVRASKAVPDSRETKQAEEAERQAIAWFKTHLVRKP